MLTPTIILHLPAPTPLTIPTPLHPSIFNNISFSDLSAPPSGLPLQCLPGYSSTSFQSSLPSSSCLSSSSTSSYSSSTSSYLPSYASVFTKDQGTRSFFIICFLIPIDLKISSASRNSAKVFQIKSSLWTTIKTEQFSQETPQLQPALWRQEEGILYRNIRVRKLKTDRIKSQRNYPIFEEKIDDQSLKYLKEKYDKQLIFRQNSAPKLYIV